MISLLLAALGAAALVAAVALLVSFGSRFRVGRLLASTPAVAIDALPDVAAQPDAPYVRIDGRIDSEDEFEDAAHRPLVYRRTRVQVRRSRRWTTAHETREAVPFRIADALGEATIDPADLGVGLVVVPRESTGRVADVADRVPPGTPADLPVRVRIEQISSVEHAIVLGVPRLAGRGVQIVAGRGRPLVLTTLEPTEAMRVLADGRQPVIRAAAALFVVGVGALALGLLAAVIGLLA
ncbi:MAG TPA: hypothetical protein VFI28_00620 [Candidatus Limnocylindrales bacterium]|nr:hypothetical protein [Candidatus Limnocylindrales bacterium]